MKIHRGGLKYIQVLFEFKHTEFFTSHGGYLLNTNLKDPSVVLVAGLDCPKFGFYQFSFCLFVVIVISILLKTTFIAIGQGKKHF